MAYRVWEYARGSEMLSAASLIEVSGLEPHGLEIEMLSRLGEYVTVLITSGKLGGHDSILHVEQHGNFEILSVEPWPGGRFMTLRPWPSRD